MATEEGIRVSVDLGVIYLGEDGGTVQDYILNLAAAQLLATVTGGEAKTMLRQTAGKVGEEELREALRPLIAEAVEAAFQPTTAFGEPTGNQVTLREVIIRTAEAELRERRERRDTRSGRRLTLVQELLEREVETQLRGELKEAIDAAKAELREAVTARGAEVLTETLERLREGR